MKYEQCVSVCGGGVCAMTVCPSCLLTRLTDGNRFMQTSWKRDTAWWMRYSWLKDRPKTTKKKKKTRECTTHRILIQLQTYIWVFTTIIIIVKAETHWTKLTHKPGKNKQKQSRKTLKTKNQQRGKKREAEKYSLVLLWSMCDFTRSRKKTKSLNKAAEMRSSRS